MDEDGYFWFVGRTDDVINSVRPSYRAFEVESVLMEHPAVMEAGVIIKPDPHSYGSRQGLCCHSGTVMNPPKNFAGTIMAFARRSLPQQ